MTNQTWGEVLSPQNVSDFLRDFIQFMGIVGMVFVGIVVTILMFAWFMSDRGNRK